LGQSVLNLEVLKLLFLKKVQLTDFVAEVVTLLFFEATQLRESLLVGSFFNSKLLVLEVNFLAMKFIQKSKGLSILLLFELFLKFKFFVSFFKGVFFLFNLLF
jgi:hypothetical protein